jgi:hypothetical protein
MEVFCAARGSVTPENRVRQTSGSRTPLADTGSALLDS